MDELLGLPPVSGRPCRATTLWDTNNHLHRLSSHLQAFASATRSGNVHVTLFAILDRYPGVTGILRMQGQESHLRCNFTLWLHC